MALPRANRLRSGYMISLVCRKGASRKSPFFRAVFLPARKGQSQVVVVVSKKYDKRAVARNLIRRRIVACIEKNMPKSPLLVVIFPYESARTASYKDLEKAVEGMMRGIGGRKIYC